jgi:HD-GYP domain-containing protein (c-di-GMP phosphodiesterase class II)
VSIAQSVRHHHERYDGAGYPDGLAGDAIPLASRIIGITDAFDAMTCERPYRRARTQDEALVELRNEAGQQFDPNLVGIFCELVISGATDAVGEANSLFFESDPEINGTAYESNRGAA